MRRFLTSRLTLVSIGHFTVDSYSSFFTPLLPLMVHKLDLSLARAGALVALSATASSFSQPLFGWLADHLRRPWFVACGPLVAAVFLSAVGLAPTYGALVALLMIGGFGVAAFHPQSAVLARSATSRPGPAMSLFVTAGTLGFALGPLFAVSIAGRWGLERTWLAAPPGLAISVLLFVWFARVVPRPRSVAARPALSELKPVLRPLALLYTAVVSRSAVSFGFMTFLPLHLDARGYSVQSGGVLTSLYLALGALGGLLGGWVAERRGGRSVVVSSFLWAAPLYLGFLLLPEPWSLVSLVAGGFVLQTSLPVNVVLGQDLSPRHSSTISSLLMGGAWGVGALLVSPVGALADRVGIRGALFALSGMLALGFACALALPDIRPARPPAVEPLGPPVIETSEEPASAAP